MPTNFLHNSFLNPVKFTKQTPDVNASYNSKHIDDWQFRSTIFEFQQDTVFNEAFQQSDSIRIQLQSNYGPINLKMTSSSGGVVYDQNFTQMQQSVDDTTLFIYQIDVPLNSYAAGCYQLKMTIGSDVFLSEPISIDTAIPNSLLLEYSHFEHYQDIIFETGFAPMIRIPGFLIFKTPASKDTMFEDQVLNETMLKSIPYRIFDLFIGSEQGVPDYFIDKINRILGCSSLLIDGKYYSKNDGSKLADTGVEYSPVRGWQIEMREAKNRSSLVYQNDVVLPSIGAVINVDSKGFGHDAGGTVLQLTDVN